MLEKLLETSFPGAGIKILPCEEGYVVQVSQTVGSESTSVKMWIEEKGISCVEIRKQEQRNFPACFHETEIISVLQKLLDCGRGFSLPQS